MPIRVERESDGDYIVINEQTRWPIRFVSKYKFHLLTPRLTLRFVDGSKRTFVHHTSAFNSLHSALVHSSARRM